MSARTIVSASSQSRTSIVSRPSSAKRVMRSTRTPQASSLGCRSTTRYQGQGIGPALLKNLECRAAAFGARHIFGDTLRSNDAMIGVARKIGLCLRTDAGRLETGALRKTYRGGAKGNSLRQLAARGRSRLRSTLRFDSVIPGRRQWSARSAAVGDEPGIQHSAICLDSGLARFARAPE